MAPQTDDGTAKEETTTVSFADLVFAHHLRQVERYKTAQGQNGRPFESDIERLYELGANPYLIRRVFRRRFTI